MTDAVYSTEALRDAKAQPYKSMEGKLEPGLLKALEKMGYEYMTPVQSKVLASLPTFRTDCLVQAKTGTGKTIAFLLPALHSLLNDKDRKPVPHGQVGILIMSPTRELAMQIAKECDQLIQCMPEKKLKCYSIFGGTHREKALKSFMDGNPTIAVATPGRLNDILGQEEVREKFTNIRTLILDEADTMLESGFLVAVKETLRRLPPKSSGWQGMCFSATVPDKVREVMKLVLAPGYTHLTTVDNTEAPTVDRVPQFSVMVPSVKETFAALYNLIKAEKEAHSNEEFKVIVFGATANTIAHLYHTFTNLISGVETFQLQSRLTQAVRTRTTEAFKSATSGLMFASDVIGRGMDFPNVSHVIQVGLPSNGEQYIHRVGRTARAGQSGRAIILLTEAESYFTRVNPKLPIKPYPTAIPTSSDDGLTAALEHVPMSARRKAYQAWLGFHKTYMKQLQSNPAGIVRMANAYAEAMGCPEPPMIDKRIVGKMGLKGVAGLRVGTVDEDGEGGPAPRRRQAPSGSYAGAAQNGAAPNGAKRQQQQPRVANGQQSKEPQPPRVNGGQGPKKTEGGAGAGGMGGSAGKRKAPGTGGQRGKKGKSEGQA